jgi:hypothetical protein
MVGCLMAGWGKTKGRKGSQEKGYKKGTRKME